MPRHHPVIYKGVQYATLKAAVYVAGLDYPSFLAWKRRYGISGFNLDEMIAMFDTMPYRPIVPHTVTYKGTTYKSYAALSKAVGITRFMLYNGLSLGLTPAEAVERALRVRETRAHKRTDHTGHVFDSVEDMCAHWNITPSCYRYRRYWRRSPLPLKGCLTGKTKRTRGIAITDPKGTRWYSIRAMCRYWGVTYSVFLNRYKRRWPLLEALTVPPGGRRK